MDIQDELERLQSGKSRKEWEVLRLSIENLKKQNKKLKNDWWINIIYLILGTLLALGSAFVNNILSEKRLNSQESIETLPFEHNSSDSTNDYKILEDSL